jgi:hypothetical protein
MTKHRKAVDVMSVAMLCRELTPNLIKQINPPSRLARRI